MLKTTWLHFSTHWEQTSWKTDRMKGSSWSSFQGTSLPASHCRIILWRHHTVWPLLSASHSPELPAWGSRTSWKWWAASPGTSCWRSASSACRGPSSLFTSSCTTLSRLRPPTTVPARRSQPGPSKSRGRRSRMKPWTPARLTTAQWSARRDGPTTDPSSLPPRPQR